MAEETTSTETGEKQTTESTETTETGGEQKETSETSTEKKVEEKATEKVVEEKKVIEDEEPPVRKTKYDYILERKQKKLETLKKQEIEKVNRELEGAGEEGGEEETEPTPEEVALVRRVVDSEYGEKFKGSEEVQFQAEMTTFLATNPEFAPYKTKIEKWSKHPAYAELPLAQVAYAACGGELLRIGAEKAKVAKDDAAGTKTGGGVNPRTEVDKKKDYKSMTPDQFRQEMEQVRRKQGG